MAVRIRLQRHGRKRKPFYWIVAADNRVKRDGKFLEKLGTYNPVADPAQIELNIGNTVKWLRNGAQPSETARRILSYKGVMLKYHLSVGVDKGALTEEEANGKFDSWLSEKNAKIESKRAAISKSKEKERTESLKAEKKAADKRLKLLNESHEKDSKIESETESNHESSEIPKEEKEVEKLKKETSEKKTSKMEVPSKENKEKAKAIELKDQKSDS